MYMNNLLSLLSNIWKQQTFLKGITCITSILKHWMLISFFTSLITWIATLQIIKMYDSLLGNPSILIIQVLQLSFKETIYNFSTVFIFTQPRSAKQPSITICIAPIMQSSLFMGGKSDQAYIIVIIYNSLL